MNVYLLSDFSYYYANDLVYRFHSLVRSKFMEVVRRQINWDNRGDVRAHRNRLATHLTGLIQDAGRIKEHLGSFQCYIFMNLCLNEREINWETYKQFNNWILGSSDEMNYVKNNLDFYKLDELVEMTWHYFDYCWEYSPNKLKLLEDELRYQIQYVWSINRRLIATKLFMDFLNNFNGYLIDVRKSLNRLRDKVYSLYHANLTMGTKYDIETLKNNEQLIIDYWNLIPTLYQKAIPKEYL